MGDMQQKIFLSKEMMGLPLRKTSVKKKEGPHVKVAEDSKLFLVLTRSTGDRLSAA